MENLEEREKKRSSWKIILTICCTITVLELVPSCSVILGPWKLWKRVMTVFHPKPSTLNKYISLLYGLAGSSKLNCHSTYDEWKDLPRDNSQDLGSIITLMTYLVVRADRWVRRRDLAEYDPSSIDQYTEVFAYHLWSTSADSRLREASPVSAFCLYILNDRLCICFDHARTSSCSEIFNRDSFLEDK